jgi:hypothetical protein
MLTHRANTLYFSAIILLANALNGCGGGDEPMRVGTQINTGGIIGGMEMESGTEGGEAQEEAGEVVSGMEMPAGMMGGAPVGGALGTCTDQPVDPDVEYFASEVGPSLVLACSGCHNSNSSYMFKMPVTLADFTIGDSLEGDALDVALEMTLERITPGDSASSYLLKMAYDGHSSGTVYYASDSDEYQNFARWIDDQIQCIPDEVPTPAGEEMGGDPVGGDIGGDTPVGGSSTSIFCDLLPDGDPQDRADGQYYQVFQDEVNASLITSCASRGGCHQTATHAFWLQQLDAECSTQANFLMTQSYIDFTNYDTSPILTAPYDPEHQGYMIFQGRDDPRFRLVRNWIILAFQ